MKKNYLLLLFISSSLFAQDFEKNWDKILKYENEGLIKSADEQVNTIYKSARKQKNEVQIIKCFFYHSKYLLVLEENAKAKIISNLTTEINSVSIPSKALLNLVYAKCLNSYNSQNYTNTRKGITATLFSPNDFLSWSNDDIQHEVVNTYQKLLENPKVLKNTPLLRYEAIFDFLTLEKFKTQTLFDYLLKENIAFQTSKTHLWEIDSEKLLLSKQQLLGDTEVFLTFSSDPLQQEDVKNLIRLFQLQEKQSPSLENQLERVLFCHTYLLRSNIDYLSALNRLQKKNPDERLLQKILYNKAEIYAEMASKKDYPLYNQNAIATLDSILANNNHSNIYKFALEKKAAIQSRSLLVQLKKNLYSNQNTRAFISYKNIDSISISFFKIDAKLLWEMETKKISRDSLKILLVGNKAAVSRVSKSLLGKNDYLNYTTEILLPPLKTGNYLALLESNSMNNEKISSFEILTVSDLMLLSETKKNQEIYKVVNRKTGFPIENVQLKSDYFQSKTDKNGQAFFKRSEATNYFSIQVTKGTDSLSLRSDYYYYPSVESSSRTNASDEEIEAKVMFYLDRAIYRPGQTVYYKGIAIQKKGNVKSIIPKLLLKLVVENPESETLKEFDVTTNEFGSFSGEFTLPANGMTGNFRITAEEPDYYENDPLYNTKEDEHPFWDDNNFDFSNSDLDFKVEEYKRPKFEVSFEAVKEYYVLNQHITVNGNAKAFAGSYISGAKVTYSITEQTNYPYLNDFYGSPKTIAASETVTDASGKFKISFEAKPSTANRNQLPVFSYTVFSSVTDSNGETHTAQTNIKVGYHNLVLTANVPNKIETSGKNKITLNSTNLNGEFLAAQGEIAIYFISEFKSKFKNALFSQPEIQTIPKDDFERLFPYENDNAVDFSQEKGTLVYTKNVSTKDAKEFSLEFMSQYKPGCYRVVFTAKDSYGNPIETKSDFQLVKTGDLSDPNRLFSIQQRNKDPKKDGFVVLRITSAIADLHLKAMGNYNNESFYEDYFTLKNNQTEIKIPIPKNFEEKVAIGFESIFDNDYFKNEIEIALKTEKPELFFETTTFRNKIEPGSPQHWSFKLKQKNTAIESEILASMYDSSLDDFAKADWENLRFYEYHYHNINYKYPLGIQNATMTLWNLNRNRQHYEFNNEETKLLWFGFNFSNFKRADDVGNYKKEISRKSKKPSNSQAISGIITHDGLPLPGTTIQVVGTERFVTTDFDGFFEVEAAFGEKLEFLYVGMEPKTTIIASDVLNVQLQASKTALDEVVIATGYKSTTTTRNAHSVAIITEIEDNAVYSIEESLNGRVAGLNIASGFGQPGSETSIILRGVGSVNGNIEPLFIVDGVPVDEEGFRSINQNEISNISILKDAAATSIYGNRGGNGVIIINTKRAIRELNQVKTRTNLNETAFFFPNLKTDADGLLHLNFTSPESLTEWKLRLLVHNKNAVSGYLEKKTITQKEIMVVPNFPRFLREKDTITITSKISNVTFQPKSGIAILQLFDVTTMQSIDALAMNANNVRNFTATASGNTKVSWKITIPEGVQGIQYKVIAKSGEFSDGEENQLPVLTNMFLVTESIPLWVRENSKKEYVFENLKNSRPTTLRNHQLTLEYTSNPTWIAIKALPYLIEFEHECAEQTFARFYANALATSIINSNPKIASAFETWRKYEKPTSNLKQNENLKSILLAETPWLADAKNDQEQQLNLALLFDLEKMKNSQEMILEKLSQKQKPSGGFGWFDGSEENEFITQHIVAGLGHLENLNAIKDNPKIKTITKAAIAYLDGKFLKRQQLLVKNNNKQNEFMPQVGSSELHFLYARSFYTTTYPLSENVLKNIKTYLSRIKSEWLHYPLFEKALAVLILNRFNEKTSAKKIIESLKQTAASNDEIGMYWIENKSGWNWNQSPIETQALLIEAFAEADADIQLIEAMKVWLIKNKQSKNWPTTKATTEAIYALLMFGKNWPDAKENTEIKIGNKLLPNDKNSANAATIETGYQKISWKPQEIRKEMATISIENKSKVPGFGGFYWQYFEDLDKIVHHSGNVLSVSKELYLKETTIKGLELKKIDAKQPLKIGSLVTVRLIITANEGMDFVHLKDMRASCFEPVNVLSEYKHENRLGYYVSTKDAATHFFFERIEKGVYVLEYDLRVNNSGDFSNGITTIMSMYAPEFASHTKGIRISTID